MTNKLRHLTVLAALLVAWAAPPALAESSDADFEADGYQAGTFGRLTYQEGGVMIVRAAAEPDVPPEEEAGINAPIFPGDALSTAPRQRAEVQLADGSLVRIDRGTELTFLALPRPYAEFEDNTILQLASGAIRVATPAGDREEFRVDTPASSIYLLGDGDARIEVGPDGRTFVASRRGVAEVVGDGGSILVRGGTRTEVTPGAVPDEPYPFNTFLADAFDRWVDDRDAAYQVRDRYLGQAAAVYDDLPYEVRPYYRELSRYGRWVWVGDYGYVWSPTGVTVSWRPYYDGYWDYGPYGYFWVSYEPWGWAPYHYGRWNWVAGHGWCWIPGRVFAGAWVAWSWGSIHVGWAPLDYWNRPAYVRFARYGYYDPGCWTFLRYEHLYHRHYVSYAVPVDRVLDARSAVVVTRPPRVGPRRLARSADWRERAAHEARQSVGARVRAVDREARPERTMRDVERRMVSGRDVRRERAELPGRPGSVDRGRAVDAAKPGLGRGTLPARPRRITGGRSAAGRSSSPAEPAPRSRPAAGSTDADRRVRDLYRRMASPRTTREPAGPSRREAGSSTPRSRGSRDSARPDAGRSGAAAAPGRPRTETPRSRPSTPKARPRPGRSSGSGDSGARPRSGSERKRDDGGSPETSNRATAPTVTRAPVGRQGGRLSTIPLRRRTAPSPPSGVPRATSRPGAVRAPSRTVRPSRTARPPTPTRVAPRAPRSTSPRAAPARPRSAAPRAGSRPSRARTSSRGSARPRSGSGSRSRRGGGGKKR